MNLKEKIAGGQEIVGIMIQDVTSPIFIPIIAQIGYDFVILDQEHGPSTYLDVQNFVLAAKNTDLAILVRSTNISHQYIARILDMGADGLMIPHVDSPQEAHEVIKWAKYPPQGYRSWGMRPTLSKVSMRDKKDYINKTNETTVIFAQVESEESAGYADEIVSTPGIDGVIIGPADFTMNLGIPGEFTNPKFTEHAERVLKTCQKHSKAFGIHFGDINLTNEWRSKGMNILLHSTVTGLFWQKAYEVVSKLKTAKQPSEKNLKDVY
jgi:2-keto-3-deoxy-L-rhamnonate aldolase RhmA